MEAANVDVIVPEIPAMPIYALFGEAVDSVGFAERRWHPSRAGDVAIPGLSSGVDARGRRLAPDELARAREALAAAQAAHTHYLLTIHGASNVSTRERARFVLGEVVAVLNYFLDDGVEDERDVQFAQINEAHGDTGESADAMALALTDYAALARPLADELDGLGGFNRALIDEATSLAAALLALPRTTSRQSPEARVALAARNTRINELYHHVRRIRAAARFVFRHHPDIAREATSTWERQMRAARARRKLANAPT